MTKLEKWKSESECALSRFDHRILALIEALEKCREQRDDNAYASQIESLDAEIDAILGKCE